MKKENGEEISSRQQIFNCRINPGECKYWIQSYQDHHFSEYLKIWASGWDLLDHND